MKRSEPLKAKGGGLEGPLRGYGARRAVRTDARGPGGVQLSWGPAVTAFVQLLYKYNPALAEQPEFAAEIAEAELRPYLPARQRARLLERGS
jgi:hypothetical protein